MRYRLKANHIVKTEAMRLPAEDEDVDQESANWLAGLPYAWHSGRFGSLDIRAGSTEQNDDAWFNIPAGHWITRDAEGFIGTQDHESFEAQWEPDDE